MSPPLPPITERFELGAQISEVQQRFLDTHGFILFDRVASLDEVESLRGAIDHIQDRWVAEDRRWVHGIPIFYGKDCDGAPFVQRFTFSSMFSQVIRSFVRDARFEPIRRLIGEDARVGDDEKDGVVINRYLNVSGSAYPRLGWHTDGLRDLFYLRMPQQMLNIGLHLDDCTAENGGLRLIPGSHRQGFFSMCFRKPYFVWHRQDPKEITVETRAGDLTVHDGRLWHRVARSQREGWPSLRRSMYVPYLTGPREPKSEDSPTPFYHHLGRFIRWCKRLVRV
jgi:phytanoyl-CoA hydroxylase